MAKILGVLILLALAGCSGVPRGPSTDCSAPTTAQCEIEMYMRVGA